ncbi:MAG TPA: hypothetical protein PLU11_02635 [Chitinophagaceae bacterium]|nr:hypothetical protein [Chitinophagaceae bacterium]
MKFYFVACGDRVKCLGHAMRGLRAAHSLLGDGERGDEFESGFYPG